MKKAKDKVVADPCQLAGICDQLRNGGGKKVVLTTGAFDLMHEGHLRYLEEARSYGDVLVVGINDDNFVKNLKGQERPIIDENARAFMIAGFGCVDYVHIFGDRLEIVRAVRPNVFVMFAQSHCKPHEGDRPEQQHIVRENGGEVIILDEPMSRRYTTTSIIKKLKGGAI